MNRKQLRGLRRDAEREGETGEEMYQVFTAAGKPKDTRRKRPVYDNLGQVTGHLLTATIETADESVRGIYVREKKLIKKGRLGLLVGPRRTHGFFLSRKGPPSRETAGQKP